MKILRKVLPKLVTTIIILIVVVLIAVSLLIDSLLKTGIETAGTMALNVGVKVSSVDLSITGGSLSLKKLVISNPPGYQHDNLLVLDSAKVEIETASLLKDVVIIRDINLDGINLTLEQRGISGNNLQDILDALHRRRKEPKTTEPSGKKLKIDNLEISNVTVNVKFLPIPGKMDTVKIKLAPIKMTDLGADNKLDTAELSSIILLAIAQGVAEQGAGVLPKEMVNVMESTLGKTIDLGKAATEEGMKILEIGTGAGKDVIDGFKGLFKKKDDD